MSPSFRRNHYAQLPVLAALAALLGVPAVMNTAQAADAPALILYSA